MKKRFLAVALLLAFAPACDSDRNGGTSASAVPDDPGVSASTASDDPVSSASAVSDDSAVPVLIRLEEIAPKGTYDRPTGLERRFDRPDVLYVVEQAGRIRLLDPSSREATPEAVLDITDRVSDDGNEQGLLGLAFHPSRPGEAYVNYTTKTHTVVSRFAADPSASDRLDPSSEKVILTFRQPRANHNGGQLAFGPDGMLYIATGDGGGAGDPQGNGQDKHSLLGKILRIDVDRTDGELAYSIPGDNPFAGGGGAPEVYAYGLRNPWRFSFDPATGRLWAADVGQDRWEEINLVEKGGNYGWNVREGLDCYKPAEGCPSDGLIPPIHQYGREDGVSVTGGYVYRGSSIPELKGWYVFADYAFGTIWGLRLKGDGTASHRVLAESGLQITSFGAGSDGEIYVCAQDGGIFRIRNG
ncbi:PQQ-dependent sugar dehydrogenase [Cohnella caldifontis]|uniref:PQQ-dependent sugar dehydrogenase n=1 Tax=Cohnella caldifontis TaxID=3027471 RepID=UPI0023EE093A|nr:PQQ-dependent sugar dehydrogenase [Cohnella sp. YIM B05605]